MSGSAGDFVSPENSQNRAPLSRRTYETPLCNPWLGARQLCRHTTPAAPSNAPFCLTYTPEFRVYISPCAQLGVPKHHGFPFCMVFGNHTRSTIRNHFIGWMTDPWDLRNGLQLPCKLETFFFARPPKTRRLAGIIFSCMLHKSEPMASQNQLASPTPEWRETTNPKQLSRQEAPNSCERGPEA